MPFSPVFSSSNRLFKSVVSVSMFKALVISSRLLILNLLMLLFQKTTSPTSCEDAFECKAQILNPTKKQGLLFLSGVVVKLSISAMYLPERMYD